MNVAEKLADEIERVAKLREQYKELDGQLGVNVKPAIFLMTHAIDNAKRAAGVDDALTQIAALQVLEGFTE